MGMCHREEGIYGVEDIEVVAALHGIQMTISTRISDLILESDSKIIVEALCSEEVFLIL